MITIYYLEELQQDRSRFDEMVELYCDTMIEPLTAKEALQYTPQEYRKLSLEALSFELIPENINEEYFVGDSSVLYVDDIAEAKDRYTGIFESEFVYRRAEKKRAAVQQIARDTGAPENTLHEIVSYCEGHGMLNDLVNKKYDMHYCENFSHTHDRISFPGSLAKREIYLRS